MRFAAPRDAARLLSGGMMSGAATAAKPGCAVKSKTHSFQSPQLWQEDQQLYHAVRTAAGILRCCFLEAKDPVACCRASEICFTPLSHLLIRVPLLSQPSEACRLRSTASRSHKLYFIRNLTHVSHANLVSFCQQSNLESDISIIIFNNTETRGLEAAAVISVTLTGSAIPTTAVTMR